MTETQTSETHRSFTVRVPFSLYLQIAELAQKDGVFINQKANQLLRLGLGREVNINQALSSLLKDIITEEGASK